MKNLKVTMGALLLSTACGVAPGAAQEFQLQFGHYLASGGFLEVEEQFIANVEERSEGRVSFNLAYSGGLGAGTELLPLVSRGAVDVAAIVPGYFGDQLLFSRAFQIPFVFNSPEEAINIARESYANMEPFQEEMERLRVHYLFHQPLGSYYMSGPSEDCSTLEGLQGKRIRTFGSDIPHMISAVGGTPISVPVGDLYEALERGTLDYSFLNLGNVAAFNLAEVGQYQCGPALNMAGHLLVMNQARWESLPEDIQAIITEEAEAAQARYLDWLAESEVEDRAKIEESGGTFVEYSEEQIEAWREATPDLLQRWVEDMEGRGEGERAAEVAEQWRSITSN